MLFHSHEHNREKIFGKQGMIFAFHWMVSSDAENPQLLIFEILASRQFLQDLRLSMFSRMEKMDRREHEWAPSSSIAEHDTITTRETSQRMVRHHH